MRIEELLNSHEEQFKDLVSNTTETAATLSGVMLKIAKDADEQAGTLGDDSLSDDEANQTLQYLSHAIDVIEHISKVIGGSFSV